MFDTIFTTEEGYVFVTMPVSSFDKLEDGTIALHALANTDQGDIGFQIDLLPDWDRQAAQGDPPLALYWGSVRYKSIGAASDRFLQMLADHYGLPFQQRAMAPIVEFTAVSLQTDPHDIRTSPLMIKLFSGEWPESTYAEFFTAIDLGRAQIQIREKDNAYRAGIVSTFGNPAKP